MIRMARFSVALFFAILASQHGRAQNPTAGPDKTVFDKTVRASYYRLDAHQFRSANCSLSIDWSTIFGKPAAHSDQEIRLMFLAQTRFFVTFNAKGSVLLSHLYPDLALLGDSQMKPDAVVNGMGQALVGTFQQLRPVLFHSFLPAAIGSYGLEQIGSGYKVTFAETDSENPGTAVELFDADHRLTDMNFDGTTEAGRLSMKFTPSDDGLLLTEIHGTVTPKGGTTNEETVAIAYSKVEGVQLPKQFDLTVKNVIEIRLGMDDCHVTLDQ